MNIEKIKNNLINILDREYNDKDDITSDGILYNFKTNNAKYCHIKISKVDKISVRYFDDNGVEEIIEINKSYFHYQENKNDYCERDIYLPILYADYIKKIIETINCLIPNGYLFKNILYCNREEIFN